MHPLVEKIGLIETELAKVHGPLPHLPVEWKNLLTKAFPWLVLIIGILSSMNTIMIIQYFDNPVMKLYDAYGLMSLSLMLLLVGSVVTTMAAFLAFPRLKKSEKLGWMFMLAASIFSGVISILTLSLSPLIGLCIGLYLLFEVRENYKN